MELQDYHAPSSILKAGQERGIPIPSGKYLKIETTPGGEEILNVQCPVGKAWSARVIVEITEVDA